MRDLANKIDALNDKITGAGIPEIKDDVRDHEGRLRALERAVWQASGIAILGGALLATFVNQIMERIN